MKNSIAALVMVMVAANGMAEGWYENVKVKGDIRYRLENIDDEKKDEARYRERIRARLEVQGKVNDFTDAGIRFTTGTEPQSGNQTLDEVFSRKGINIDKAYIGVGLMDGVKAIAGKMGMPFLRPTDLVWDGDVNPEGMALTGEMKAGDSLTLMASAGNFWINEISSKNKGTKTPEDIMLRGAQLAGKIKISDDVSLTVGGEYYTYDSLKGRKVSDAEFSGEDSSYGNSTIKMGEDEDVYHVFKYDYNELGAFAELGIKATIPLKAVVHYVSNDDADTDNTGYSYAVKAGKAKKAGSWEVGAQYFELEKDAVFGHLTDSDRFGGGTDGKGWKLSGAYAIADGLTGGITYLINDKKIENSTDYNRLQIDLVAKF